MDSCTADRLLWKQLFALFVDWKTRRCAGAEFFAYQIFKLCNIPWDRTNDTLHFLVASDAQIDKELYFILPQKGAIGAISFIKARIYTHLNK